MKKEVVVIGGGPGGQAAAIRAADLGAAVTLVEERDLGGTCLNRGCIPTKVFLEAARLVRLLPRADTMGIEVGQWSFNLARLVDRKEKVVSDLRKSLGKLLDSRHVKVVNGRGRIESRDKVVVEGRGGFAELHCDSIVIATGSRPAPRSDWGEVDTTDTIFDLRSMPKSLAIIGGGTTGVELSTIFSALGSSVTLLEARDQVLPDADVEISHACEGTLERMGVHVLSAVTIERVEPLPSSKGHRIYTLTGGSRSRIDSDRVLTAVGRTPNTESLYAADLGLEMDAAGWIRVDPKMQTSVPGICAVGDVIGGDMCAHTAIAEGILAAETIMGMPPTIRFDLIPRYVSSIPEIAWVGMTEDEARRGGFDLVVGRYPACANSRSLIGRQLEGFAKIVGDRQSGEILGAHVMADHASDMAMEAAMMISMEACLEDLASLAHPHPTYSEILMEAARNALGESVTI